MIVFVRTHFLSGDFSCPYLAIIIRKLRYWEGTEAAEDLAGPLVM